MNLLHVSFLGLFISIVAIMLTPYVRTNYRVVVACIGFGIILLVLNADLEWKPIQRVKVIYPCELTPISFKAAMRSVELPSDSTIMEFDPMTAQCGDTLFAYLLMRQSAYGLLYTNKTHTIVSKQRIKQYEGPLVVPWLY